MPLSYCFVKEPVFSGGDGILWWRASYWTNERYFIMFYFIFFVFPERVVLIWLVHFPLARFVLFMYLSLLFIFAFTIPFLICLSLVRLFSMFAIRKATRSSSPVWSETFFQNSKENTSIGFIFNKFISWGLW